MPNLAALGRTQRASVVRVAAWVMQKYEIPLDRDHFVGHYELHIHKRDPGRLDLDDLLEDVFHAISRPSPPVSKRELALGVWTGKFIWTPETIDQDGWAHYDLRQRVSL